MRSAFNFEDVRCMDANYTVGQVWVTRLHATRYSIYDAVQEFEQQ